jgi:hypothetical protein
VKGNRRGKNMSESRKNTWFNDYDKRFVSVCFGETNKICRKT